MRMPRSNVDESKGHTDFKADFSATFEDAKMMLKRIRRTVKPLGYCAAVFGSTVLNGEGHDIDLQCMGTDWQKVDPGELAMLLIRKHAKRVYLYEEQNLRGHCCDVWLVFVTHDSFYLDLHIKGFI